MENIASPFGTILFVDDEESDRELVSTFLRQEGYTVLEADSYQRADAVFESNSGLVAMLIADISLPDGNGCELALTIRERKPNIRVLFVSGHVGAEVCKYYGLDVGDLYFLRKPFSRADLINRVREMFAAAEPFPRLYPRRGRSSGA